MPSFIDSVVSDVLESIRQGYYDVAERVDPPTRPSLREAAEGRPLPIIAEIKRRSPASGRLAERVDVGLALELEEAGASALSFIVERKNFEGSIELLMAASKKLRIPVLFKDFVVSARQVAAASMCGADVILLIAELFRDGYAELPLKEMVGLAHREGLEVLVELHDPSLLDLALSSGADYLGVNNRNLYTLTLDPDNFYKLSPQLKTAKFRVAESGYGDCERIRRDRLAGADAFLIGSAIMCSPNPPKRLRELLACGQG